MYRCRTWAGVVLLLAALTIQAQQPPRVPVLPADEKPTAKSPAPLPAAQALTEYQGRSPGQWIEDLGHPDPSVREEAIRALPLFGDAIGTSTVITKLIERTNDHDASPRIRAVIVLNHLTIPPADVSRVVHCLALKLNDQQSQIRYYAALGLIRFGEDGKQAIGGLANLAEEMVTFEIRRAAMAGLIATARNAKTGSDPRAVNAMVKAANRSGEAVAVRIETAIGLAALGRSSDPKVGVLVDPAVKKLLLDRDQRVVIWAQMAEMSLSKVNDSTVVNIADRLRHPDVVVRQTAAQAMTAIGPKAKPGLGRVLDALNDRDSTVVTAALTAILAINDKGPDVLRALKDLQERKDASKELQELAKHTTEELTRRKPNP